MGKIKDVLYAVLIIAAGLGCLWMEYSDPDSEWVYGPVPMTWIAWPVLLAGLVWLGFIIVGLFKKS